MLVGIAGSFIGFHIGVLLGLSTPSIVLFICAAMGAAVVVLGWRVIKL